MDESLGTFSYQFSVLLDCTTRPGEPQCSIPLPLQSHLGISEGLHYRPIGDWREIFLCLRHGLAFSRSPHNISLELEPHRPDQSAYPLWQIECVCGHEDCGKRRAIYTSKGPDDWQWIVGRILKLSPRVPCDGHPLVWRKDLIRGYEIAHGSPMR
jgi:hypothetical protein